MEYLGIWRFSKKICRVVMVYSRNTEETMKTMEEGTEEKEEESLLIGRDFNARVGKNANNANGTKEKQRTSLNKKPG